MGAQVLPYQPRLNRCTSEKSGPSLVAILGLSPLLSLRGSDGCRARRNATDSGRIGCGSEQEIPDAAGQVALSPRRATGLCGVTNDQMDRHHLADDGGRLEPPRVFRRLFGLSHAAIAGRSSIA